MTALLLAPHHDDETLFAAYTCLRHDPHVVTCFGAAHLQASRGGPTQKERENETRLALARLNVGTWQQLPVRDDAPDPEMLAALLREVEGEQPWDVVFAPAVELGGHDQHNAVGALAEEIFGTDRLVAYLTYVRGHGRSTSANEVPIEADWPAVKLNAMAAYRSQINLPECRPWFSDWEKEWYA